VGLTNGSIGIIRHLGFVDWDPVDALDATNGGTPRGRKGRRNDDTISTRTTQGRGELCGDVPPQGGVQLLVDNACPTSRVRRLENTLRGEACGHCAGIGIEGYGIQVICEHLCCTEKHSGPVTSVDELDAGIRGAGQIVGDYSYQHFSTLRLTPSLVSISACQVLPSERTPNEQVLLWHSLKRTSVSPHYT